ncbi:MAG: hypothetical protein JWN48_2868 [Myxococcaceae bacterium]|nr:hypothetical protein [Myxococcaceae bacterium]
MTTDTLHLLLAWATLLGGVGCNSSSHATSTAILRPDIGAVPADLARDYEIFAHNCAKCHDIDRALTAPVTDNHHWELYVGKMMRTPSSGISKDEAPHILRFLFWYTDRKAGRFADNQERRSEQVPIAPTVERPLAPAPPAPLGPAPADPTVEPKVTPTPQGESTP